MRQVGISGIQAITETEHTRVTEFIDNLVCHDVAFLADYLEWYLAPTSFGAVFNFVDDKLELEVIGDAVGVEFDDGCEGLTGGVVLMYILLGVNIEHLDRKSVV